MLKNYVQQKDVRTEFVLLLLVSIVWLHCKLCILYLCNTQATFILSQYSNNIAKYSLHNRV